MTCEVGVLFTPAEYRGGRTDDLSDTTCVVFDILRATSTMVTALAAGATWTERRFGVASLSDWDWEVGLLVWGCSDNGS